MLSIGNKTFMNLQEAVGWLLENNALPFQSTANYAGGVEIAMSTLINPSPAKVRVGSLIFFADSKVATVIGLTSNSFIVSEEYNSLVDDITYVSNVEIDASGHLICTLSNGDTIDAGLIKQVTGFAIDGSQHLIVSYNDGTSTDLGAIFSGNVNIAGNFTANSIIENMTGYSVSNIVNDQNAVTLAYVGIVKNGNKITFVVAGKVNKPTGSSWTDYTRLLKMQFNIPSAVGSKIYPIGAGGSANLVDAKLSLADYNFLNKKNLNHTLAKFGDTILTYEMYYVASDALDEEKDYGFRYEVTFLLSDNLAS